MSDYFVISIVPRALHEYLTESLQQSHDCFMYEKPET